MRKIKTNIRVADLDRLSDVIIQLYNGENTLAQDAYLKGLMTKITDLSAQITSAIKADKVLSQLDEADSKRDDILRAISSLLKGAVVSRNAEKKAAAEQLLAVFEKYKGIVGESYSEESAHIESLLEDFGKSGAMVEKVDDLQDYLDDLRTAQDEFDHVNVVYLNAKTDKGTTATSLKKPLLSAINDKLLPYLDVMVDADADKYSHFASNVEQAVEKANELIGKRESEKEEKKPAEQ